MAGGQACRAKYKTKEDLQAAIDSYFNYCDDNKEPYTVTGLALSVGLTRDQLIRYSCKDEFMDTIREAKQRCEAYAEKKLFSGGGVAGVIFSLKNNWGWRDQLDVGPDQNQAGNIKNITDDELDAEIKRLSGEK